MIHKFKKLFKLLPPLLLRDIKERYAGSAIGIFWAFLQPLLFILLYWLVFAQILKIRIQTDTGDIPFLAFLLSGLLPWFAFQEGVMRGASSIVDKRHIIKKVIFPLELFPLTSVLSSFVHNGIGILIFFIGFFTWQGSISVTQIFFIAALLSLQIILTSGISMLFAALSVYIRDIIQVLGVIFQLLFYTTTILYPMTAVPDKLKAVILLNPFTPLVESYHNAILYGKSPEIGHIIYVLILTVVFFSAGVYFFRKVKKGFADVL